MLACALVLAVSSCSGGGLSPAASTAGPTTLPAPTTTEPFPRNATVYEGLGAWVDVFDFVPAYQEPGQAPLIAPREVEAMYAFGVRTLYIQAARNDERTPEGLVDQSLLAAFVSRAHAHGIRVVAWYLPKLIDVEADLARITAMRDFRTPDGQRFDGLALDIEFTQGVEDVAERNRRLVDLSTRARALVGTDALGAIVLSPVLLEVVNADFWPAFPWGELASRYDVWLPMVYWTERREDSGYRDGYRYTSESVARLRADLGRPAAPVHPIGGLASGVDEASLRGYVQALAEAGAVGGSLYDYRISAPGAWALLRQRFP
jgi:hypothetical protein